MTKQIQRKQNNYKNNVPVDKNNNKEKFKIIDVHTDGKFGNDIEIVLKNGVKVQIAVEDNVNVDKELIGKFVELDHKKIEDKYYFERVKNKLV